MIGHSIQQNNKLILRLKVSKSRVRNQMASF